ncbi:MAG: hypothetical protein JNK23_02055 [Opitutaceae bacterium]|nr:hypothetical protein [Opitutaceae bacterium]
MKRALLIVLSVSALLSARAEVVTAPAYGLAATFPTHSDWTPVEHKKGEPHSHVLTWSAKSQAKKQMIYLSIIDAPLPDRKPTFRENALEWERGVRTSSKEITQTEFTTLGGREAYKIVGKVLNFGSEFFFVRWMSLSGDVTYQVSIVSEKPVDLERGVFHDFIESLTLQKKETNQAAKITTGTVPNLKH